MLAENLSVGVMIDPPYAYPCFTGGTYPRDRLQSESCRPGFGIEITVVACEMLKLVCKFTVVNHTAYGTNLTPDGSWNGMIGQILNGEFDTSLPGFNPTKERVKVLRFSPTHYYDENIFLTNSPTMVSFGTRTIPNVFSWEVWLTILGSIVTLSAVGTCIQGKSANSKVPLQLVEVLSGNVSSNLSEAAGHFAFPLLMLFWGFGSLLLASYFSSQIVASAIDSMEIRVINDLESFGGCLKSGGCQILSVQLSTSVYERIRDADLDDPFHHLKVGLETNPPRVIPGLIVGGQKILESENGRKKLAVLTYRFNGIKVLTKDIDKMCDFDVFSLGNKMMNAYPFRKYSPVAEKFDDILFRLRQSGVSQKIYDKYFGAVYEKHGECKNVKTFYKAMPVKTFFAGFLLISASALLAFLVLLLEKVVHRKRRSFGF